MISPRGNRTLSASPATRALQIFQGQTAAALNQDALFPANPNPGLLSGGDQLEYFAAPIDLQPRDYYSAAQTYLVIGDTIVSDAVFCQYNDTTEHQPYHGYRDKKFSYVFEGRQIVAGVMAVNLQDARLMDLVVNRTYPGGAAPLGVAGEGQAATLTLDELVARAIREGRSGEIPRIIDDARALLIAPPPAASSPVDPMFTDQRRLVKETLRWLQSRQRFGIDIHLHYGDPLEGGFSWENRRHSTGETIKSVIFTGQNRQVQTDDSQILQEYTFFAREVAY